MRKAIMGLLVMAVLVGCGRRALPVQGAVAQGITVVVDVAARQLGTTTPIDPAAVWGAGGRRLLFLSPGPETGSWGPAMYIPDLATERQPLPATAGLWYPGSAVWGPGESVIFSAIRQEPALRQWEPETLYQEPPGGGRAVELLPGDLAVQSVSTAKRIHGMVDRNVLAYEEHAGTSVQRLLFAVPSRRTLLKTPELMATWFIWAPDKRRVAGQWSGGPLRFWIWDRVAGSYLVRSTAGYFESWGDANLAYYTAWEGAGAPHETFAGRPTLHRLDVTTGKSVHVADSAGLAVAAGGRLAYISFGPEPALRVVDAATGQDLWMAKLGRPGEKQRPWSFRPHMDERFILYRNARGQWFISEAELLNPVLLYTGDPRDGVSLSPGGRYIAFIEHDRMRVIENPLWRQLGAQPRG